MDKKKRPASPAASQPVEVPVADEVVSLAMGAGIGLSGVFGAAASVTGIGSGIAAILGLALMVVGIAKLSTEATKGTPVTIRPLFLLAGAVASAATMVILGSFVGDELKRVAAVSGSDDHPTTLRFEGDACKGARLVQESADRAGITLPAGCRLTVDP